jgi:hypothetical protein
MAMSDLFYLTMIVCTVSIAPFVIWSIRLQIRRDAWCWERWKEKDRKEAEKEAQKEQNGFE